MLDHPRRLRLIASVGLVLAGLFWLAHLWQVRVESEFVRAGSTTPLPLNGVVLDFQPAKTAWVSTRKTVVTPRRTVVLVYSDRCPVSERESYNWVTLLRDTTFADDDAFLLVSFRGFQQPRFLVQELERRQISWRLLRVTDAPAFGQRTGIASRPQVLILDSSRRVRFVTQTLDQATFQVFHDVFNRLVKAESVF
jgi:hypothetical protein